MGAMGNGHARSVWKRFTWELAKQGSSKDLLDASAGLSHMLHAPHWSLSRSRHALVLVLAVVRPGIMAQHWFLCSCVTSCLRHGCGLLIVADRTARTTGVQFVVCLFVFQALLLLLPSVFFFPHECGMGGGKRGQNPAPDCDLMTARRLCAAALPTNLSCRNCCLLLFACLLRRQCKIDVQAADVTQSLISQISCDLDAKHKLANIAYFWVMHSCRPHE